MKPSRLSRHVNEYLDHRRSFGYELKSNGRVLADFVRYVAKAKHRGHLTADVMLTWATTCPKHSPRYQAARLSVVRGLARYLAARDGRTEVPAQNRLPNRFRRGQPHVFSDVEVGHLVKLSRKLRTNEPFRGETYAGVFGLLASTGIRVSEALGLRIDDVDLKRGILLIRETKFHKSRLVPMHSSTTNAMSRYAIRRERAVGDSSPWFFVGRHADPLTHAAIWYAFRRVCLLRRWRSNGDLQNPRIHDLRHNFAIRRLLDWYRDGVDVEHAIASLSTYLGHGKITDTYWYLTGTPELLAVAARKFGTFVASAREGR